jgi:hypothetical protein
LAGKPPNNTILLSVRSPIFAPLYLAKVRGNAFRNIDFKYAFELPTYGSEVAADINRADDLAYRVLSKSAENEHYIAGVADPFRCLVLDSDGALYKPKVLGSMIRHQTFWLASDQEELKSVTAEEALAKCRYIISQRTYTSGYAVLKDYLETLKVNSKFKDFENAEMMPGDLCNTFGSIGIYHKTQPGFEREHYKQFLQKKYSFSNKKYFFHKSCQNANYAYLTTNPADHEEPIVQFSTEAKYHNTLMSALFCGSGVYCKYPMLFDDIRADIMRAIQAIHCDPVGAAVELKEYSGISGDRFMDFSNKAIRHRRLVEILDDLIRDRVYAEDMSLSEKNISKGAELRPNFRDAKDANKKDSSKPAAKYYKKPDEFMAEYFDPFCVRPSIEEQADAKAADKERTEGLPPFVRHSMRNYRKMADKYYGVPAPEPAIRARPSTPAGLWAAIGNLKNHMDLMFLIFGGLLALPSTLGALGLFRPTIFLTVGAAACPSIQWRWFGPSTMLCPSAYWQWFGPAFFLTLPSLGLLYFAYLERSGRSNRKSTHFPYFDLFVALGLFLNASVVVWALLVMLDRRLVDKVPINVDGQTGSGQIMSVSDQMSVELFLLTILIGSFGALWLAASERIADSWERKVLRRVEWRILKRVKKAKLPDLTCHSSSPAALPCHACPRAPAPAAPNTSGPVGGSLPTA